MLGRIDKLKERLIPFVKEQTSVTSVKIPYRIVVGYKLDEVSMVLKDLLIEKYHKNLVADNQFLKDNDYFYNFKEI